MLRNASTIGDGVLLIAALCFHSVFEGIAIGVAGKTETELEISWILTAMNERISASY